MPRWLFIILFCCLAVQSSPAQESSVESLSISGTKRLNQSFVRKIIQMKPGMPLDSVVLNLDMIRLIRLPSVSHAYYEVKSFGSEGHEVVYKIEENFTLIPFANIFLSTNDEFAYRIGLQEFNFLGRGIVLGAFFQHDIFDSYGFHIRAPNLFSRKLGLALHYNNFNTQEPVFIDDSSADYRYNNEGFEILGLYEINLHNRIEFGFSRFTEDYDYLFGTTSPDVPLNLKVDKFLWKFIYDYSKIGYYYQYLSGFRSVLNLQFVRSSDPSLEDFVIGFNDFLYFARVGEKGNWANRLRLGLSSNPDTPFAPFSVDNNLNIRGVGNTIDRGTGSIVLNTEFRQTLVDKDWFVLQGNFFIDAGSWRNPGADFSDFGRSQNIRVYPGIGLRFIHKRIFNAIFRIDYGYGITKDASSGIVFGIGQYF